MTMLSDQQITKFQMLYKDRFGKEISREEAYEQGAIAALPLITPCASSDFPRPARRPTYSSLLTTKLPKMRLWEKALGEYIKKWGDKNRA